MKIIPSTQKRLQNEAKATFYKSLTASQHGIENFGFWERPMLTKKKNLVDDVTPIEFEWMFNSNREKRLRQQRIISIRMDQRPDIDSRISYLQEIASIVYAEYEQRQDNEENERIFQRNVERFNELKTFINQQLNTLILSIENVIQVASTRQGPITKSEIALICHYRNIPITKSNAERIAKQFDDSIRAGRLYQDYSYWHQNVNRLSIDDHSKRKNVNKIKLFERVMTQLEGSALTKIQDDINTLKSKIKNSSML